MGEMLDLIDYFINYYGSDDIDCFHNFRVVDLTHLEENISQEDAEKASNFERSQSL